MLNTVGSFVSASWREIPVRRFAYGMLGLTLGWVPVLMWLPVRTIVDNALFLESYLQLMALAAAEYMAVTFCVTILRVINSKSPHQGQPTSLASVFGDGSRPWNWRHFTFVVAGSAISPLCLMGFYSSEFHGWLHDIDFLTFPVGHIMSGLAAISGAMPRTPAIRCARPRSQRAPAAVRIATISL